jgi:exoribonuclease-2
MTQQPPQEVVPGTVLEFFDDKKIVCGVCIDRKEARLSVLTEQNREINLSRGRVLHFGEQTLNLGLSRDDMVQRLATTTAQRKALMEQVQIEELWSLLEGEDRGFSAAELAGYIFADSLTDHHVAAVLRVMLAERLYFKYKAGEFFPRSAERLEQLRQEREILEEQERLLEEGATWLQRAWQRQGSATPPASRDRLIEAVKSFCLFGQESPDYAFA